jgi:hypothetical protein
MRRGQTWQHKSHKAIVRHHYSQAFFTSFAPLLMMISGLSLAIGSKDPVVFFSRHWIFSLFALAIALGLLAFGIAEVRKGRAYAKDAKNSS